MVKDIKRLALISRDKKATSVNNLTAEPYFEIVYKSVFKHEAGNFKVVDDELYSSNSFLFNRISERERLQAQLTVIGCRIFGYR